MAREVAYRKLVPGESRAAAAQGPKKDIKVRGALYLIDFNDNRAHAIKQRRVVTAFRGGPGDDILSAV